MQLSKLLVVIAFSLGSFLPARALEIVGPFPNSSTFDADNKAVIVFGSPFHIFRQQFIGAVFFTVSGASIINGEILEGNNMPISSVVLQNGNIAPPESSFIAGDSDGSDGFRAIGIAPTAGTYSFIMNGSNASGTNFLAVISAVPYIAPVPEPETWVLIMAGLCVVARKMRRNALRKFEQLT